MQNTDSLSKLQIFHDPNKNPQSYWNRSSTSKQQKNASERLKEATFNYKRWIWYLNKEWNVWMTQKSSNDPYRGSKEDQTKVNEGPVALFLQPPAVAILSLSETFLFTTRFSPFSPQALHSAVALSHSLSSPSISQDSPLLSPLRCFPFCRCSPRFFQLPSDVFRLSWLPPLFLAFSRSYPLFSSCFFFFCRSAWWKTSLLRLSTSLGFYMEHQP